MDFFKILGVFVSWPFLALIPSVFFTLLYLRRRRLPILITALAWFAYVPYEQAMKLRLLCSGECNIRVDLVLLYPLLALLSVAATLVYVMAGRATRS